MAVRTRWDGQAARTTAVHLRERTFVQFAIKQALRR